MKNLPIFIYLIALFSASLSPSYLRAQLLDDYSPIRNALLSLKDNLDTFLFVSRFESVETPCLYIDSLNDRIAFTKRKITNSNYQLLLNDSIIDSNGIKCMSNQYCRYLSFHVDSFDPSDESITGTLKVSYGYPASTLIQYLGFTNSQRNKSKSFFSKLLYTDANFRMELAGNRYRITLTLTRQPFDPRDSYTGYLEIVASPHQKYLNGSPQLSYQLIFDQMSIYKGDNNNQIALRFSSTTHSREVQYFAIQAYNIIKWMKSPDTVKKANAIWLTNFLTNPACSQCQLVFSIAKSFKPTFLLPNTEPIPPH